MDQERDVCCTYKNNFINIGYFNNTQSKKCYLFVLEYYIFVDIRTNFLNQLNLLKKL